MENKIKKEEAQKKQKKERGIEPQVQCTSHYEEEEYEGEAAQP